MNFEVVDNTLNKISSDGVVLFAFEDQGKALKTKSLTSLDKILGGIIDEAIKVENFKGKIGETLVVYSHGKILSQKIYILGLGKKENFDLNKLRKASALFAKNVKNKVSSISLTLLDITDSKLDLKEQSYAISEGLLLGSYEFNKYKSEKNKKNLETVIFGETKKNAEIRIKEGIKKAQIYYNATKLARDLVNDQSAVVNPTFLAELALEISKKDKNIKCEIYDKKDLEKMGMEAFLGVARASDTPPKFICLEYTPKGLSSKKKLAIVGKGITFDTGGISIKPEKSMTTMKCDMAGAAAVLGVFSVISEIKPDFTVMGLIAATPNMISGKSLVPGDILKAMNGKTIEILNTDAEGRVTMADSLSYAVKKGATEIIDVATLTGAAVVALGENIAALFGNNEKLKEDIKKAAKLSGEEVWELPLVDDYRKLNKSEVADIANLSSGGRSAGAITAALFLKEFIADKPWVHLDLCPAFAEKTYDFGPKGGTGFGVRLLLDYLKT